MVGVGESHLAFEADLPIVGLYEVDAAKRLAARPHQAYSSSASAIYKTGIYHDFAIPGFADDHPIPVVLSLRLGGPDSKAYDLVDGFRLTLPSSDVAPDEVMVALRAKYGRPDHHSHDGLGVIWTQQRRTEAVMTKTGIDIDIETPAHVFKPLEVMDRDDTTNASCNRYVASFDAYLACRDIPYADRLAMSKTFAEVCAPLVRAALSRADRRRRDHSGEGANFVPSKADVTAATAGCAKARLAIEKISRAAKCAAAPK